MDAVGGDEEVVGAGAIGDGAFDDDGTEFLHAAEALEAGWEEFAVGVEDLDGGDGLFDEIGVVAADIPGGCAGIAGHAVAGGEDGGVADGEHGAVVDEDLGFADEVAGDDDFGAGDGILAGLGDGDGVGRSIREEEGVEGLVGGWGDDLDGRFDFFVAGGEGEGGEEDEEFGWRVHLFVGW